MDIQEVPTSTRLPKPHEAQQKGHWVKYFYDSAEARRAVRFIEQQLIHVEGKHAGQSFVLEWWQKKAVLKFFGWKHRDTGKRRYRVLFIFVPRKNGKTALAAAISLYLQFADREAAAQVVCAAADKEQAGHVFRMASEMVKANQTLLRLTEGGKTVYKTSIYVPSTTSVFKVLSKRPNTKHGANIHGAIIDEVHAIEDRELVDVLTTGTIARAQPVIIYASTAGFDKSHFFYDLYTYAKAIQADPTKDETWLNIIYEADPDKWKDPEEWKRVNPNFGVTMDLESFQMDFRMAVEIPAYENTFKRLRLNIWTEQDSRAIPMEKWNLCIKESPVSDLEKRDCFLGLDLASTTDLAAGALVFPPFGERDFYDVQMLYWFPESNLVTRKKKLRGFDLTPWADKDYITLTPGEVIDYDIIRTKVNEINRTYRIREIAIDRWNATQLATQLDGDGFTVVPTGMGYATMSDPTKFLLSLVLGLKLNQRANPVLEWNARNLATEEDAAGNLKPSKRKSKEKIDGIVAVILALSRALVNAPKASVYQERGVRVIG